MVLPSLSSLPTPVVFFACFLVVLTFLGAFALRLAGFEDEPEYYEEVGPDGKVRVAFQFPPHESREDRRRRWARALRRRFWPGLAAAPEYPEAALTTDREVEAFIHALLSAAKQPKAGRTPPPPKMAPAQKWEAFDPEYDCLMFRPQEPQPEPEPEPEPVTVTPEEARKIRRKIFSVVMNAGPPKSLPPISEEELTAIEQQAGDLESGPAPAGRVLMGRCSMPSEVYMTWPMVGLSRQKEGPIWSEFDSEPIMSVGDISATRSVLWAALRKLEGIDVTTPER